MALRGTVSFLTQIALSRRSVTVMIMILVVAAGVYSYNQLSQELFPDISFGTILIYTGYQQDPNTNIEELTTPIENVIIGMADLERVTSITTSNTSIVTAEFATEADIDSIEEEIRSEVSGIDFPDDAWGPTYIRLNSDIFPVMFISVTGERDIPSLQRIIDDSILPRIEAVDGVYDVQIQGGITERVSIIVDPALLDAHGLTLPEVIGAVSGNAADVSAGNILRDDKSVVLRTYHGYTDLDSILNIPVGFARNVGPAPGAAGEATPILLSSVARVAIDTPEAETVARTNGQPSVSLNVLRLPDANTIALTEEIISLIDELSLPPDVDVEILYDDGPQLQEQLSSVTSQGAQGFVIAVLAIFLFLLQIRPTVVLGALSTLRPTFIIGASIPLSVMATILVMAVFDWNINFMSLAGLAISVGRIVDDSIVVLENTYRRVQAGEPRTAAAIASAREVGPAILASTLTTVAVFLPLAFVPGEVGQFFLPFAQTVCVSLLASTLVALTAVPVLASILLRTNDMNVDQDVEDTWLQRIYTPLLLWALRHRFITVAGCIVAVGASLSLITIIPITLFSAGAPQSVRIDVTMPENTDAATMFLQVQQIEEILDGHVQQGDIENYLSTIGALSNTFGPGAAETGYDVASFFIPTGPDAPADFPERLRSQLPDAENVDLQMFIDESGPPQAGLEVNIFGDDFNQIKVATESLLAQLATVPGVVNVKSNIHDTSEELTFAVDPAEAGRYGLTAQAVAGQVRTWAHGLDVADVNLMGDTYDVVVRGRDDMVDDLSELQQLTISGPLGSVPLGAISEVKTTLGPSVITHYDGERSATIIANFDGADRQAISNAANRAIAATTVPPDVTVLVGGFASQIQEQFNDVYLAMIIGVSLVYIVMVTTMGSLRDPFIIVLSMPLAVVGAFVALAVTDRALSLSSLMGFLFLIGIVVTNAIVLLTFVGQLRERQYGALEAIIEAGRTRLRPIVMTAFTTIFAIFPLAFSSNTTLVGAELATVVIGGLISSTFLTLVAVPVTYMLLYETIPNLPGRIVRLLIRRPAPESTSSAD